jgi:hypothetical protein
MKGKTDRKIKLVEDSPIWFLSRDTYEYQTIVCLDKSTSSACPGITPRWMAPPQDPCEIGGKTRSKKDLRQYLGGGEYIR